MKFFFKVRVTANHPVKGFVFPNLTFGSFGFVDFVSRKGFDGV